MHDGPNFLQNLALVLCVAAVTTVVSRRVRLPVVFGYLVAGMIVGPFTPLPLFADAEMVRALSELGVVLLMYSLGLEFRLGRVLQIGATAGVAALAETSLMFGLGYAIAALFGWSDVERLFTGAIVAISSTTIIARTFTEQGVKGRLRETVFGILIVEDLIAILLIAVLSTIVTGGGVSGRGLALTGIRLATFLVALIAIGRVALPWLVRRVVALGSDETTVVLSVGLSFAAALLALAFGYSVALGAFIVGSLVAESGEGERIAHLIAPVRDIFVAIFFVSVGMLIEPRVVAEHWAAILGLSVVVIVGKFVAVSIGAFLTGNGLRLSVQAGMSLAQIGEFSFIIAGVALAGGATRPFLYPVAIAVSALTTLTTPLLVKRGPHFAQRVDRSLPEALQTFVSLYATWFDGLRRSRPAARPGLRRAAWLILGDVALLGGLMIAAAAEMNRLAPLIEGWFSWQAPAGRYAVLVLALGAATPFVAGLVRMTRFVATELALRAMPGPERHRLDRAAAPRIAFVATLQYGLLLACAIPLLALLQPMAPRLPVAGAFGLMAIGAAVAVWRSATALYGHARAGAEVIVMALMQKSTSNSTEEELAVTMDHVAAMLPGLGDPESVRLVAGDPGVGRSLGELDLRGETGATVLAILRRSADGAESITPRGSERLREGDVLALAGTEDAIVLARQALVRRGQPQGDPDAASAGGAGAL
ncbi:MAG: cation:proton antiporter [Gemmatimonadaceae bacterium]|nr:cation:proton antiporter [Gemmatimonadaceae bacterium]